MCPALGRLAAAASGEDAFAAEHVLICARCRAVLDDQHAVIAMVEKLPAIAPSALDGRRRRELAAAVAARADEPAVRGDRRFGVVVAVACAAALAIVIAARSTITERPAGMRGAIAVEPAPEPRTDTAAPAVSTPGEAHAVVAVVEGVVAAPRAIVSALNHADVVALVRAFAPSKAVVPAPPVEAEHDDVYVAPPELALPVIDRDASVTAALSAFRTGWEALRADRYADAIAAFDRATDQVVAEDAAFWAAIAAERAHDVTDAARRLRDFLARFPSSPHADAARAALARAHP